MGRRRVPRPDTWRPPCHFMVRCRLRHTNKNISRANSPIYIHHKNLAWQFRNLDIKTGVYCKDVASLILPCCFLHQSCKFFAHTHTYSLSFSKMKRCELCKSKAAIYCRSDRAILCWGCDARVHSANFLVARHSRCLLCGLCLSRTPWTATGAVLSPTMAVCEKCLDGKRGTAGAQVEERKEVVEENQIAPPSENSSCSCEAVFPRKRRLENDDDPYCSSYVLAPPPAAVACVLTKEASPPQKVQRAMSFKMGEIRISESGILESLRRFHREELGSGLQMAECCTLNEDGPSAVDLSSCDSS